MALTSKFGTRTASLSLMAALTLGACASAAPSEIAFTDTADEAAAAAEVLEHTDEVAFQANWMCELQRRTFADIADRDAALDAALVENGLSRAAYDSFLAEMAESQPLRDAVLTDYQERCRA